MAGSPRLEYLVMGSLLPLLLLSTTCSGYTTHYIKPTPSTPCPADPCFTLSEYAQLLHYVTSNTTLLLLPGDHILSVNFTLENVSGFEILSSADSHATIVCQGLVGLSFRNISHMAMDGLTINSCGMGAVIFSNPTAYGVSAHSVLDTRISNCSFQDSVVTALGVFHSNMDLRGSNNFTGNCRRCSSFGGGIYSNSSVLTFNGYSIFRNNSADFGGGILSTSTQMNFNGNSIFRNNLAKFVGGGILSQNSTLNFHGSSIFENNSAGHSGGGIYVHYYTSLNFDGNSIFRNNSAAYYGGGISARTSTLNFSEYSIFSNNSADYGGGISFKIGTLNFNGSNTFENNSAARYGGGICAVYNALMNFNGNVIFRNNSANSEGGGIYILYSNLSLYLEKKLRWHWWRNLCKSKYVDYHWKQLRQHWETQWRQQYAYINFQEQFSKG